MRRGCPRCPRADRARRCRRYRSTTAARSCGSLPVRRCIRATPSWRKAPLWNQSSPIQPSTIGANGTATLSAGCGCHRRHDGRVALVGTADRADTAIALGHVLHEPFDRVVAVSRMVGRGRIQRAAQRLRHDVVAFGTVFPAHVLVNDDVAGRDRGVVHLRHDRREARTLEARNAIRCVVRRACQQDRRVLRPLRHQDEGLELDAVAHRDHFLALHDGRIRPSSA